MGDLGEHGLGVGEGFGADLFSGEEAGDFLDAVVAFDEGDLGGGAALDFGFFDAEVAVGAGGDLGQVGDGEDLVVAGDLAHFVGGEGGGAAGESGVHFVEDEGGDTGAPGTGDFDGEHDAGHFSAGGDAGEGAKGFAGVGGEVEFEPVGTEGAGFGGIEADLELGFGEGEIVEVLGDEGGEFGDALAAEFGEGGAGGAVVGFGLGDVSFEGFGGFGDVFEVGELLLDGVEVGVDFGFGFAVFAEEALDEIEAFLGGFDGFGVVFDGGGVFGESVGGFAGGDEGVAEELGGGFEFGIETGGEFGVAEGGGELGCGGGFGLVGLVEGVEDELAETLGVLEAGEAEGEGFGFAGLEVSGGDFVDLVAEEIETLFAVAGSGAEGGETGAEGGEGEPGGGDAGFGFVSGGADPGVEELGLAFGGEEGLVVVLAVEVYEECAELAEGADGGGASVDADGAAAFGGELAVDGDLVVVGFDFEFGEGGKEGGLGEINEEGDGGFGAAGADEIAVGASSEGESDGVGEEGFAGAGFSGEDGEAGLEIEFSVFNGGDIGDGKGAEHGVCRY